MPQAPTYLQEEFEDDSVALKTIENNYEVGKGFVIRPRIVGYKGTDLENRALDYLWLEWDFAFEGC
jgi:hypothetical protein